MTTEMFADTVAKLIVNDENDTHTTLEGVDRDSAEYVGFDIKNVGIFGYILLQHENSGRLTVTLEGENYVILQTTVPENNEIKGIVECSAVLDANDMMLPVPIEVAKNFSHEFEVPTFAWGT